MEQVNQMPASNLQFSPVGEMNIYTASDQKNQLVSLLDANKNISIDLSNVSEIDTAGIQLLLFAKQESEKRRIQIEIIDFSDEVLEAFELTDLSKILAELISNYKLENN